MALLEYSNEVKTNIISGPPITDISILAQQSFEGAGREEKVIEILFVLCENLPALISEN